MTHYAESGAVIAWLFGEEQGGAIARSLAAADSVATSALTLLECERAILRKVATGDLSDGVAAQLRARLFEATGAWSVEAVTPDVLARAREPFPVDAIRSLDAIHLATALVLRTAGAEIEILSLDERVRINGRRLGFPVIPE